METSVKAAEVLVPPQPDEDSEVAAPPAACCSSSSCSNHTEEFSRRLEDIISTHGSAADLLDRQSLMEAETEKMKKEPKDDIPVAIETEVCLIMKSLDKLSPQQKLEDVVRKYAELAAQRRSDEKKLCVLQQRLTLLLDERQQQQAESRSSITARSKLETLCRELHGHYSKLREETLQRVREDEEKRTEMTSHFQMMLTEIQTQIEQHSTRNDKLCQENSSLTDKLESLMNQCEMREESLEKINHHRDLQYKLNEAKMHQAQAQLKEAEEKHKREKEYLLREAIDKTKKCFAMKEQELALKKKLLVQAAEWKLQTQTLREQGTVMQAQLTLYAQKFDEFQATLAKSNEIYVRFKKEMDNMSEKMKKMENESNLWKTRFENCNRALTNMIEEREEKGKEYELFVLKITKLEKLCRALQDERIVLYEKIKEVRKSTMNPTSQVRSTSNANDAPVAECAEESTLLTTTELQDLQDLQNDDPILTENMARLREEQAKLQAIATSLCAPLSNNDEEDISPEEDLLSAAFTEFQSKTEVKEVAVPVPVDVKSEVAESVLPQPDKVEEVPEPVMSTPVENTSEMIPTDAKPEAVKIQTQVEDKEVQPVKAAEEIQQQPAGPVPESEIHPPTDVKQEAAEAEVLVKADEVKPVIPVEVEKVQAEPVEAPQEAPTESTSTPPSDNTPQTNSSSNGESSKKQTQKKKKKRNGKNAS